MKKKKISSSPVSVSSHISAIKTRVATIRHVDIKNNNEFRKIFFDAVDYLCIIDNHNKLIDKIKKLKESDCDVTLLQEFKDYLESEEAIDIMNGTLRVSWIKEYPLSNDEKIVFLAQFIHYLFHQTEICIASSATTYHINYDSDDENK